MKSYEELKATLDTYDALIAALRPYLGCQSAVDALKRVLSERDNYTDGVRLLSATKRELADEATTRQ